MKDINGKVVKVGDKVAYAVTSFAGYLGLAEVIAILPAESGTKTGNEIHGDKAERLKLKVIKSSKYTGAAVGKEITLGNSGIRQANSRAGLDENFDTIFIYERKTK